MYLKRAAISVLALLIVLAGACTPSDTHTEAEPVVEVVPVSAQEQVSEAYLLERIHARWGWNLGEVFRSLWFGCPGDVHVDTRTWPDDRTLRIKYGPNPETLTVTFEDPRYDPELSAFEYGDTSIDQNFPDTKLTGHAYIFDLRDENESGKFEQTDTVTLESSRSVSMSQTIEFDVGVDNSTTVGGEYLGVKFEDTLKESFGYENTSERQQAESESKSHTETHTFDVDLAAGRVTLIALTSDEVHSSTPFTMNAVADFGIKIRLDLPCPKTRPSKEYDDWYEHGPWWLADPDNLDFCHRYRDRTRIDYGWLRGYQACTLKFESVERFGEFLGGTHERWPGMGNKDVSGWISDPYYGPSGKARDAWKAMKSPDNRRIRLTGTQHRVYEHAITEKVNDVTGHDVNDLAEQWTADVRSQTP